MIFFMRMLGRGLAGRRRYRDRVMVALFALTVPGIAQAQSDEEECLRDSDCEGAALCPDRACVATDGLSSCEVVEDCRPNEECHGGYCKFDGVACENSAGRCEISRWGGSCRCLDGQSDAWSAENTSQSLPDVDARALCESSLLDRCGEAAPELPESCDGPRLELCERFEAAAHEHQVQCEDEESGVHPLLLCCEALAEDPKQEAVFSCFADIRGERCEDADAAARDCEALREPEVEEPSVDDSSGGDSDDASTSEDPPGSEQDPAAVGGNQGCSFGANPPPLGWMAASLILLGRSRRKRSGVEASG